MKILKAGGLAIFLLGFLIQSWGCGSKPYFEAPPKQEKKQARLLILHSYHQGLFWVESLQRAIEQRLASENIEAQIYTEYLDSLRHPEHESLFTSYIASRYQNMNLDGILISDNSAFEWMKKHRQALFPAIPLVFCGLNSYTPEMTASMKGVTGVAEKPSFKEILGLIQWQFHNLKTLLVLGELNITFVQNQAVLEKAFRSVNPSFSITYHTNPEIQSILKKIGEIEKDSAILMMTRPTDNRGQILPLEQTVAEIARKSPYPIYSAWDFFMGHGILGGKLISGTEQGEKAAWLMSQILRGERPENLPVIEEEANRWMFDGRVLKRFGMDEDSIPPQSLILFNAPGFYEKYKALSRIAVFIVAIFLISILILSVNIRKRKLAEQEAIKNEQKWKFAIEGSGQGIWDWNLKTNEVFYSRIYKTMLGYTEAEFPNLFEEWRSRVHPEDRQRVFELLNHYIQGFTPFYQSIYRILKKDGTYHWILTRGKIMETDEQGNPLRIIGVHSDISEQKKAEEMLRTSKEEAEKSNQAKSEFLSNMSHELRTPLTGIVGCACILSERPISSENLELVKIIKSSSDLLLNLINDLLDLSKIEAGKMKIQLRSFNIHAFFDEIQSTFKDRIQIKGIEFRAEKHGKMPDFVIGDDLRIRQILHNLLGNAIKFTEKGSIAFSIRHENQFMFFTVADTGIGIQPEKMKKLFEKFDQGEFHMTKKYGGTGLGLAIVKSLTDLMDGSIEVKSVPGEGTVFTVILPMPGTESENEGTPHREPAAG